MKKGYLVLSDGTVYQGFRFGARTDALGELVFTTGMGGYIEALTDPSFYGQIVMHTFPLIGNYGIIEEDFEGDCVVRGYVVREKCDYPSNFRCEYGLDRFLKDRGVPGLYGVDTRAVTKHIREAGVMNAVICDEIPADLTFVKEYEIRNAVQSVTSKERSVYPANGEKKFSVTLIDYGTKRNIIRELQRRGCEVTVVPSSTSAEEILASEPDGIMLSNGPGDPAANPFEIEQLKKLFGKKPIFGICLGHQILGLAAGGSSVKMKFGHRGENQPVKEVGGTKTYITCQNHGYALVADGVKDGRVSFINANDGTCEGMEYPEYRSFTVQFHPEACAGPRDTEFLFDRFIENMGGKNNA